MTTQVKTSNQKEKPLGVYLVEAGLVTPAQVDVALDEQKVTGRRLGEIMVAKGWVKPQTIEYLLDKVVSPERQAVEKKLSHSESEKNGSQNLTLVRQESQAQREDSTSLPLLAITSRELEIYLSPKRTIRFLLLVVLGLILVSLVGQFTIYFLPDYPFKDNFAELFDVDGEKNIPALYSTSALLLCSILLANIAYAKKVARDRYVRYWQALSIIFLYLSLDEAFNVHEVLGLMLRSGMPASGFLYYAWVLPGFIFVIICLLAFLQLLTHLPAKTRHLFLIAGTLFVGGAIGINVVTGYYVNGHGDQNMTYAILSAIEESLEMLGIIVFIYALLSYMTSYINMKDLTLRVHVIKDRK